ncbi:hypothetical protein ACFORO_25990 [Amycolatopsis halotolerans]|uniref:Uncharacterized protein n=1 Tax=Amycolatopsis halotolerans TaxID=330083 RepID=A0ABV7QP64_9PSEU
MKRIAAIAAILVGLGLVIVGLALLALQASGSLAVSVPGKTIPATATPCAEDEPCWDCHTMGNRKCGPPVQHEVVVSITGAPGTVFRVKGEVFGDTGPINLPESGGDSAHFQTEKAADQLDLVVYVAAPIGDTTIGCAVFYDDRRIANTERVPLEHTNTVACRVNRANAA